jgi:protein-L-isoaspartate(D-aspartate) O-methyltransferase
VSFFFGLILSVVAAQDPLAVVRTEYAAERLALVHKIKIRSKSWPFRNRRYTLATIAAIGRTPRHLFLPEAMRNAAYADKPLPIGHEQTISAPSIVAIMTALAQVNSRSRVLEIGTGSGYQAAVLSTLVRDVYTVEIVKPLAQEAAARLDELGYNNVYTRLGDGYAGWPENAPFDAIIITAGANRVPQPLIDQLKPGGRLVIPLGPNWAQLELLCIEKLKNGKVRQRKFGQVFFVPFTRSNASTDAVDRVGLKLKH